MYAEPCVSKLNVPLVLAISQTPNDVAALPDMVMVRDVVPADEERL